jgi:glucose/arabinose dehydrogenase
LANIILGIRHIFHQLTFFGVWFLVQIGKFTLNADFTQVVSYVISQPVAANRKILGLAFDPLDTSTNPTVYCTSNEFFHGEWRDSSGKAINGKIHAVSGANLDIVVDIITGLPVSDHDHGLNAIVFGNNGELYMTCGSNTNGGKTIQ